MIADIYIRVSTTQQAKGSGLERQREGCIKWCEENNVVVRNIVQDVCSAFKESVRGVPFHLDTESKSPNCGNLGRYLKSLSENPPDIFVFEDWDRLDRSLNGLMITGKFKQEGVRLHSVYGTLDNDLFNDIPWSPVIMDMLKVYQQHTLSKQGNYNSL